MNKSKFNPGDIVTMKSGSPLMTVSYSDETETYVHYYNYDTHNVSPKIKLPTSVLESAS